MIKTPSGKNISKNYEIKFVQTFKNNINVVIRVEDDKKCGWHSYKKDGC